MQNKGGKYTCATMYETPETEISTIKNTRPHFFRQNVQGRESKIQNKGGKITCAAMHLNLGLRYRERCKNFLSG